MNMHEIFAAGRFAINS